MKVVSQDGTLWLSGKMYLGVWGGGIFQELGLRDERCQPSNNGAKAGKSVMNSRSCQEAGGGDFPVELN